MGKFSDICGLLFTLCGILEFGDRVCETAVAGGLSVCQPESGVTCILLPPTMMQGGDILNIENIVNIVTCILLPPTTEREKVRQRGSGAESRARAPRADQGLYTRN